MQAKLAALQARLPGFPFGGIPGAPFGGPPAAPSAAQPAAVAGLNGAAQPFTVDFGTSPEGKPEGAAAPANPAARPTAAGATAAQQPAAARAAQPAKLQQGRREQQQRQQQEEEPQQRRSQQQQQPQERRPQQKRGQPEEPEAASARPSVFSRLAGRLGPVSSPQRGDSSDQQSPKRARVGGSAACNHCARLLVLPAIADLIPRLHTACARLACPARLAHALTGVPCSEATLVACPHALQSDEGPAGGRVAASRAAERAAARHGGGALGLAAAALQGALGRESSAEPAEEPAKVWQGSGCKTLAGLAHIKCTWQAQHGCCSPPACCVQSMLTSPALLPPSPAAAHNRAGLGHAQAAPAGL